ncbi:acyl carrier protein [Luteibacter sp. Sphag1AF]|uniref:acyl carrier protein n=1 Tax=Luteibacter sp. Sphag1AF TaxID=2587031 RepID=UPI001617DAC8|nr:acyl carrier protein [Luteibacter sp. Sphag1AF]MBB3225683.1 acyl carrier protein [Luteibacter sp. Sphag1AF]
MSTSVEDRVLDIIAASAKVDRSTISTSTTLAEIGVTSLDAIEIIFDIEEAFEVTLPEGNANFDTETIASLVEAVEKGLAIKAGSAPPA